MLSHFKLGYVSYPLLIGPLGDEVPLQQILGNPAYLSSIGPIFFRPHYRLQTLVCHQSLHNLLVHQDALILDRQRHAPIPIEPFFLVIDLTH